MKRPVRACDGYYLDGRVAAVVGTHTHVQTNDEQILPGRTAYITDTGMTGFKDGILAYERRSHRAVLNQLPVSI